MFVLELPRDAQHVQMGDPVGPKQMARQSLTLWRKTHRAPRAFLRRPFQTPFDRPSTMPPSSTRTSSSAQLSQGRPPIRGFWGERDEPNSNGLQLQPNTDGLQPKSDGFQPECRKNELAILTGCCLGGLATVGVGSLGGFKPFSRTCLPWRRDSTSSS